MADPNASEEKKESVTQDVFYPQTPLEEGADVASPNNESQVEDLSQNKSFVPDTPEKGVLEPGEILVESSAATNDLKADDK